MRYLAILQLAASLAGTVLRVGAWPNQPWYDYIYSPSSRNPTPESVHNLAGDVLVTTDSDGYVLTLNEGGLVTLDFGREVGGIISFNILTSAAPNNTSPVSLAFSESPLFARAISDDTGALPTSNYDLAYNITLPTDYVSGTTVAYTEPSVRFRGGFRFVTLVGLQDSGTTRISNLTCEIGFAPDAEDLKEYTGWFYTPDDELLNRIWYAGAYTVQTNIAPANTGRYLPQVKPGWAYNASLGIGSPLLLDGAKRDRAVWPGDLGISIPSALIAFGPNLGWPAVRNSLLTMFSEQNTTTGEMPFAGPDTASEKAGSTSQTYHCWSLIALGEVYQWGGEGTTFVEQHWSNITAAVGYTLSIISSEGLINQTQPNDWGRLGGGGYNSALNALAYGALKAMANVAQVQNTTSAADWNSAAESLKSAYNTLLWDESASLFFDNTTTTLHPQDGNALAVYFNVTTPSRSSRISSALLNNWNQIGPVTPELADTISPFVSGLEVYAHYLANEPDRALELVRREWGYILDSPIMGGSTLVEGMTANGSLYYRSQAGYNYDPSYTSLSHSWSSGPTSALTRHLLGLSVASSGNVSSYTIYPSPGSSNISSVEGGLLTPRGTLSASWTYDSTESSWTVNVTSPSGIAGKVGIPLSYASNGGTITQVQIDGRTDQGNEQGAWYVVNVEGGNHTVQAWF